jgi:DNA-binding beta-propeller fold protein YncE
MIVKSPMKSLPRVLTVSILAASAGAFAAAQDATVQPHASIEIPASKGKFDFLRVDDKRHRLLAAHENDGTADYFDLGSNKLISRVKVGGAVDNAVDPESKYYYVSVQEDQRVAVLDAATLKEVKSIKVDGPTDAIIYEPKNHMIYVTHDEGANVWVIDPAAAKVVASIEVPGVPEFMVYDESTDRIYLNIKSADMVAVIDPGTNKTVAKWATAPATQPHGLALDSAHHRIFSAGANGKLAVIDTVSGKVVTSVPITAKVDQIAFDPKSQLVFCAGPEKMSMVRVAADGVSAAGDFATAGTARNVAVDAKTGAVWSTYTDGKSSFAKSWMPQK